MQRESQETEMQKSLQPCSLKRYLSEQKLEVRIP